MKEKIKRIINLIVLLVLAVIMFVIVKAIPNFLAGKETVSKLEEQTPLAATVNYFEVNTGNLQQYGQNDGVYWRVTVPGISQLYCASKGSHLSGQGYSYEEVVSYVNSAIGKTAHKSCANPPTITSRPYYRLTSTRPATAAEAFILTWPGNEDTDWNVWTSYKQEAIWKTPTLSDNKKAPAITGNGMQADVLALQAAYYQQFIDTINKSGGTMNPQNATDINEVVKTANQETKEYTVGPFCMGYVYGNYGIVFGGISDMYIVGENNKRIEIQSFIVEQTDPNTGIKYQQEIVPSYFTTIGKNHLIGIDTQQSYPLPAQKFYVKYTATEDEQINNIHADFTWMEAESTINYYDAIKYKSVTSCTHTKHCHGHTRRWTDGAGNKHSTKYYCSGCCYNCEVTSGSVVTYNPGYQKLLSAEGTRKLRTVSLDIPIPANGREDNDNPGNDTPKTNKNLQIKLAGNVWVDEKTGKETLVNGIKDSDEKMMPGVEVILHYADGSIVTKNVNGDKLVNPTVTDQNGYYEFVDLNAQSKYYIEFVYNGQIYQPTNYTDNLSGGYSNATEVKAERLALNDNFAEISSAPGNYKVRRSLYYNVGQTNTAYILGKTSSETPYGIKEIYEYLIERAVATKSYSTAYSDTLNHFGNNDSTKSKLQFIEDLRVSSYTGQDTARKVYPIYDQFVEDTKDTVINGITYHALYPEHLQIDFGLTLRETFDFAFRKDVQKATVEINGKTHTYTYDTRNAADETDDGSWDISVRLADTYYNTKYSREVFGSDYQYKASNYGDNSAAYGKTKEDELNVYVTYKLTVRNQSQSVLGEVMEIVDYYDEDYEYVNDRSYIEIKNGNNNGIHDIKTYNDSIYGTSNQTQIPGYNALYVRGLEGIKLTSGQTAYVYLTFKIKKDNINGEDWIRLDEQVESAAAIGVGKENIAEINGFKTYYKDGTQIPNVGKVSGSDKAAGLLDKDSVPGNLSPNDVPKDGNINYNNFEDDTDKAPNIRLILYRENGELVCRTMDGIVWEDERTEENKEQVTTVADGIKQAQEKAINGVTVQLVELMDNGTEYVWKTFSSGQNYINGNDVYTPVINVAGSNGNMLIPSDKDTTEGKYIFKSYMAGNFVVRFIYGDTVKTVLPNTATEVTNVFGEQGQNAKSYNGQDYKSTTYQEGIVQSNKDDIYNNNTSASYVYNITASDANANVSDAKDIMTDDNLNNPYYRQNATLNSRKDVIDYSDNDVTNYIAEVLASHEKLPLNSSELASKLNELMARTQMTAETGRMDIEVEYDRNATGEQIENNSTTYKIQNLNLGLEERPKAQLSINKEVTNVKLTLADGSTLFDASQKATNVLWRDHKPYEFKYKDNKLVENPMTQIREKNTYDVQYGLIQLSMDEELMHGATIKISYKITVTNVGEVDYKDNMFYYTGITSNRDMSNVVTTEANQVIDYVANNLQFYAVDNNAWKVIPQDDLLNGLVNMTLANETAKYNTVITTSENSNIAKAKLTPKMYDETASSVSDDLVLTQLITSENETDDLTYRNIVEIVKTSNDVGRRNAYSVVGNQNPTEEPTEVDSDRAEIVKILPPYGNGGIQYIIATIIVLASAILITGIIFIKKKVLR